MSRELIAMCGLAFSGKSTIARQVAAALDADLISYDAINAARGFDGGKAIADAEWEKTSMMAAGSARQALANGRGHIEPEVFAHHRARFQFPDRDEAPVRLSDAADLERWLATRRGDNVVS